MHCTLVCSIHPNTAVLINTPSHIYLWEHLPSECFKNHIISYITCTHTLFITLTSLNYITKILFILISNAGKNRLEGQIKHNMHSSHKHISPCLIMYDNWLEWNDFSLLFSKWLHSQQPSGQRITFTDQHCGDEQAKSSHSCIQIQQILIHDVIFVDTLLSYFGRLQCFSVQLCLIYIWPFD